MKIVLGKYLTETVIFFFMLLVLLFGIYLARVNLNVQIKSFDIGIKTQEYTEDSISSTRLIVKYLHQKEIYQGKAQKNMIDRSEFTYNQYVLPLNEAEEKLPRVPPEEKAAVTLINILRTITGNPRLSLAQKGNHTIDQLYNAYHSEKNKNYPRAVEIYNTLLSNRLDHDLKNNLILHRGYCEALMEDLNAARSDYNLLITREKGTGAAMTAQVLLRYLDLFETEKSNIQNSTSDPLTKGEKLSQLLYSKTAIQVLEDVKPSSPMEKARLEYYKGSCYEELGEKQLAIESYGKAVQSDQTSPEARYANRKIYSIAADIPGNQEILDTCVKVGIMQKDSVLLEIDKNYQEIRKNKDISPAETNESAVVLKALQTMESNLQKTIVLTKLSQNTGSKTTASREMTREEIERKLVMLQNREIELVSRAGEEFTGTLRPSTITGYISLETAGGITLIHKNNIKAVVAAQ